MITHNKVDGVQCIHVLSGLLRGKNNNWLNLSHRRSKNSSLGIRMGDKHSILELKWLVGCLTRSCMHKKERDSTFCSRFFSESYEHGGKGQEMFENWSKYSSFLSLPDCLVVRSFWNFRSKYVCHRKLHFLGKNES